MIYKKHLDEDTIRAFSNLEENISFKKVLEFIGKCLREEEAGCRQLREHIDIDRCLGRQQALFALTEAADTARYDMQNKNKRKG